MGRCGIRRETHGHADGDDEAGRAALCDGRRRVGHGNAVADANLERVKGRVLGVPAAVDLFLDGERLAREQGLVRLKVDSLDETQVGGHDVACLSERGGIE